jgi:hypothetical protein
MRLPLSIHPGTLNYRGACLFASCCSGKIIDALLLFCLAPPPCEVALVAQPRELGILFSRPVSFLTATVAAALPCIVCSYPPRRQIACWVASTPACISRADILGSTPMLCISGSLSSAALSSMASFLDESHAFSFIFPLSKLG